MIKKYIDFAKTVGKVKPMHCVNNGPIYKFSEDQRITNIQAFRDAEIPYIRNHDAAFNAIYGGEHCVDVNNIFTDFSKDPYDPNSYDFELTDNYVRVIEAGKGKTFYRLGSKIEHWTKKYNTLPPKDFHKWAVICEHIIRHYTGNFANGLNMDIEYWEIWNEPDLDPDDSTHKRTWGGTAKEFYELYNITANHLKKQFPNLKIGGPAVCCINEPWIREFFKSIDAPVDFFSWHRYTNDPYEMCKLSKEIREILDDCGHKDSLSILNEWNYVKGWTGDDWYNSLKTIKSLKGASFTAANMCALQYEPLDMLMYYDARPCGMNGMFSSDFYENLKGYYPFLMFSKLYKLGTAVEVPSDKDDIFICAAKSEEEYAIMLTYYNDDDSMEDIEVNLSIDGLNSSNENIVEFYCLDNESDCKLFRKETIKNDNCDLYVNMRLYTTILITIKPEREENNAN